MAKEIPWCFKCFQLFFSDFSRVSSGVERGKDGERKRKTINIKKFGGTSPRLHRNHPVDVSHLSRGNAPSVPWTFCPIYVELHINQVLSSRISRDSLRNRPGTLPRHTDHQIPLRVFFVYRFSSPQKVLGVLCGFLWYFFLHTKEQKIRVSNKIHWLKSLSCSAFPESMLFCLNSFLLSGFY